MDRITFHINVLYDYRRGALVLPNFIKRYNMYCNNTLSRSKVNEMAERRSKTAEYAYKDHDFNETSYYFENKFRKVYPYYFTFKSFAKGRWVGRKLICILEKEFSNPLEPFKLYEKRIHAGLIRVNGEIVNTDYIIRHSDVISSFIHRHEQPVINEPITILYKNAETLVINKPASVPVHPCGRYRHNSVMFILAKEYNLKDLHPVHRLDRLTSGILIFARNSKKAKSLTEQINNHEVHKEYVCRVEGEFPSGVIVCQKAIETIFGKTSFSKISSAGKNCTTVFERLSCNGKTSVVSCKPLTGRMHQIRVHLQYLGYPVLNDSLYNSTVFGPKKGAGGNINKSDKDLISDIFIKKFSSTKHSENFIYSLCSCMSEHDTLVHTTEKKSLNKEIFGHENRSAEIAYVSKILDCFKNNIEDYCSDCIFQNQDPNPAELVMYLHAWKYKGPGWSYETELPSWAKDEWLEHNVTVSSP